MPPSDADTISAHHLANALEVLGGTKLSTDGLPITIPFPERLKTMRELAALKGDDPVTVWIRRVFASATPKG